VAASVCTLQPASDRLQDEEEVIAFVLYSALQRSFSENTNTINQFIMNLMMWSNNYIHQENKRSRRENFRRRSRSVLLLGGAAGTGDQE